MSGRWEPDPGSWRPRAVALLVLLPVAVFASSLDNGFHLDDFYRIVDNPGIRQVAPMGRHFTDPSTNAWLPRLVQYRPLLPLGHGDYE